VKIFYDTEFHERGPGYPIELISIGMVREDGEELYAHLDDYDRMAAWANPWLAENVLHHLEGVPREPRAQVAEDVAAFCEVPDLELWAWYADYDHVCLAQLFGKMIDLPKHMPMFTYDLKQEVMRLGNPQMPDQPAGEHDALADARHVKVMHEYLAKHAGPFYGGGPSLPKEWRD
jgi:hypothetical protein